jgi:hypothetical protein
VRKKELEKRAEIKRGRGETEKSRKRLRGKEGKKEEGGKERKRRR